MKYLYLTQDKWVHAWIDGGEVPLQLASIYRSPIRNATQTPDEVVHRQLEGVADHHFDRMVNITGGTAHISVGEIVLDGEVKGRNVIFNYHESDALILCLSNSFSTEIMRRLGKEACVEIADWESLLDTFDVQLGVKGSSGNVEYTSSKNRNHYLKSIEDQWQDEFRLVWPVIAATNVIIPSRTGRRISAT